jgi:hypothetical protein
VVAFLRDRELLHLDGHLGNLRTDGERLYLTDFGLVTSPRFDLSAAGYAAVRMSAFYWRLFGGDVHAGYPDER